MVTLRDDHATRRTPAADPRNARPGKAGRGTHGRNTWHPRLNYYGTSRAAGLLTRRATAKTGFNAADKSAG